MSRKVLLLAAVAAGGLVVPTAHAATAKHHAVKHRAAVHHDGNAELRSEIAALKAEVAALHDAVNSQHQEQVAEQAQVTQTQQQVAAVNTQLTQTPPVTPDQVHTEVATSINTAIEKEHHKDHADYRGITIKPVGFLEFAGIYRQHYQGNDLSSSFSVPFPNARTYSTAEGRFSARQSRVGFLAQGKANKDTTLTMYGEFDFLGAAQTANSNESNSFTPRIRVLYGQVDWEKPDHGIHLLAGQNWSLVTMNTKGITPRNENPPTVIDAQYVSGFAWARQPQIRLTGDFFDHKLWLAVSAENPQTTFVGAVPSNVTNTIGAASGFDSANSLSLNHMPDFVGKAAYEDNIAGHQLHIEGFGLVRTYTAHLANVGTENAGGYGFGGSIGLQLVPNYVDIQFSGMTGKGIGRYGTSSLPDVTFDSTGRIRPVHETMLLGGITLHPTKMLDIYGYAGEELEFAHDYGGGYGVGLITANNSGCYIEAGTCAGNTRRIRQLSAGFWQKVYNGNFGRAQVGIQYSYTQRDLFQGVGGAPRANQQMGFLSLRYYPF
ncbi:hypothetical protein [Novosphingobium rosa]|uniref:hypothetical protein n=1 Tax=Novosphingobium rosa TaxID=76978 RepID=UPI000AA81121|nr:hypothetical protein [Novosphingobium rosa]